MFAFIPTIMSENWGRDTAVRLFEIRSVKLVLTQKRYEEAFCDRAG